MVGSWILTPVEGGLLYAALAVFAGAAIVGLRVITGKRRGRPLRPMLATGVVALTLLLIAITLRTGQFPLIRRYEVILVATWLLAAGGYLIDRRKGMPLLVAVAAPTLALMTLFAFLLVPEEGGVQPGFAAGKVAHIVLAVLGFVGFSVAAGVGALYLWQIRLLKRNPQAAVSRSGPSLERLDRLNLYAASFGLPFLALSLLSGWLFIAVTPEIAARWWLDPTVLTTGAGLVVYSLLFVARGWWGWRGRKIAWLSLIGFFCAVVGYVVA
ncbi:MAG: cytochrome c biogenesis protein CcsA, partial [Deltaproteobacteria bacterium]